MACLEIYSDVDYYAALWGMRLEGADAEATVQRYLRMAAATINATLISSNQCSCTMSTEGLAFLQQLECLIAAVMHRCPCGNPNLPEEARATYLDFINTQLELLRTGKLTVCQGETGADYPYSAAAEQGVTEFAQVEIVVNDVLRNL